ncbi:MAG: S1C family serine protease [Bacillota bacterium]
MRKPILFIIVLFLSLCIIFCATSATAAVNYLHQAQTLKTMGLFWGTEKGLELQKTATRAEASVMMVRLLGKEDYALKTNLHHPFKDVPAWASPYIGYLYKSGLAKGKSNTYYGSADIISADQFTTYILRALDYNDGAGDFLWSNALNKFLTLKVLPTSEVEYFSALAKDYELTRDDLVGLCYNGLFAKLNSSNITLLQKLYVIDEVISDDRIQLAIDNDQRIAEALGQIAPSANDDIALSLSAEQIYKKCSPAVFYIKVYDDNKKHISSGSGFFINSGGMAVTNYHVIEDGYSADVKLADGKTYAVSKVIGYDKKLDIAVLKIDGSNFPYLFQANSDLLSSGQQIFTISSPLTLENSISEGIISSPQRKVDNIDYIQITAPISQGSSGGALLNNQGLVIGITTGAFEGGQNLNVAIPINLVNQISLSTNLTLAQVTKRENPSSTISDTIAELPEVGDNIFEEIEPNDDSQTSDYITNGTTVKGTLSNAYDEDIFKFTIDKTSNLIMLLISDSIHINNVIIGLYLEKNDGSFQLIDVSSMNYSEGIQEITTSISKPGTYYWRVLYDTQNAVEMPYDAWYIMYYAFI